MKTTYEAILDGDKVTWTGERPDAGLVGARVTIQVHDGELRGTDGKVLAEAIRKIIAETGGITSIEDASAWQREQRVDRPLPGREP